MIPHLAFAAAALIGADRGPRPIDVVFLAEARPVVIRLTVTSDGRPLEESWGQFAAALFTTLDANKDGAVEPKERDRLPTLLGFLGGSGSFVRVAPVDRPSPSAAPAAEGKMTRTQFADYLRRSGYGAFRLPGSPALRQTVTRVIRGGGVPSAEVLDKAILAALDGNGDGKLTAVELAAGPAALARLDADEDEWVTAQEIAREPAASPYVVRQVEEAVGRPGDFALLDRTRPDPELAKRLFAKYGDKGRVVKRLVSRSDLDLSEGAFKVLDRDEDGKLDSEELARFADCPPDVELAVRLGGAPVVGAPRTRPKTIEVVRADRRPDSPLTVSTTPAGDQVSLSLANLQLVLAPRADGGTAGVRGLKERYLAQFKAVDRDANGYLDEAESLNFPTFQAVFGLLDADADKKVFEKELVAFLDATADLTAAAGRGVVTLDVADQGRGLLGLIDKDNDGRLSIRELRQMGGVVETFDRDGDGAVGTGEVPRRLLAGFARGTGSVGPTPAPVAFTTGRMPTPTGPQAGPVWFRKMDRNRDGVVSPREFLGAAADFAKLDADADGLLDAPEAEAAAKLFAGRDGNDR